MNGDVSIRPIRSPEDDDFDLSVYASTRLRELTFLGWTSEQIDDFVRMQYQAQTRHYRQHYPDADWSIVTVADEGVGRLIVTRSDQNILIVDIALLPGYRSVGIGGIVVRRLLAEAEEAGITLRCHVEQANPARGFWEHLGLVPAGVDGAHVLMERRCATSPRLPRRTSKRFWIPPSRWSTRKARPCCRCPSFGWSAFLSGQGTGRHSHSGGLVPRRRSSLRASAT